MRLNTTRLVDPGLAIGTARRRVQNVSVQAVTAGTSALAQRAPQEARGFGTLAGSFTRTATTRLRPMSADPLTRIFERMARELMGLG
jgi:hypothetical protein